ncbi:MAG: NUDIX hydrolase [Phycisphaeraceae bacterium]
MRSGLIDRDAARVLLVDRDGRLLLFCCREPGAERSFWITPGGGLEAGETHEQAALRELHEETGLSGVGLGPCVWTRTHTFPWLGRTYRQRERFFLLRIDGHEVDRVGHTEDERAVLIEHRWWSVADIASAVDESFAPRRLGEYLAALIAGPLPEAPIDVGA